MAKIYRANGEVETIEPKNGTDFQLEELQAVVGGYIECLPLYNTTEIMTCNEEGKILGLPLNRRATQIIVDNGYEDCIAGDVLVCREGKIK
jgi:hypothetical protein